MNTTTKKATHGNVNKTRTPWGPAQAVDFLAPGISQFFTSSHGGLKLLPKLNAQVHEAWRKKGGWYEEDCEYAIVYFHFAEELKLTDVQRQVADKTLRDYFPDEYTAVTGTKLQLEESLTLRERASGIHSEALSAMRERGGNWAVYENHDLSSANVGHMQFLKYGEGCTYAEAPAKYPDSAHGLGWRYVYVGTVDLEAGMIRRQS